MPGGGNPLVQFRMESEKKEHLDAFMMRLGFYKGSPERPSRIEYSQLAVAIADNPDLQNAIESTLRLMGIVDKKDSVTSA